MNNFFIIRFWSMDGWCYIKHGDKTRKRVNIKNITLDRRDAQVFNSERACIRKIRQLSKSKFVNVPKDVYKYSVEEYTDYLSSETRTVRGYNTLNDL